MKRNLRNEILARMLTKKNVTVKYDNFPTAFVDLKTNTINLPLFDMKYSQAVEDFMLFHEIFHIFYTPPEQYMKVQKYVDHNTLNIVEDIRIEYLGRRELPGVVDIFHKAVERIALETPLFQAFKTPEVFYDDCSLVMRLSYYFRFGHLIKIPFAQEEIPFVVEASKMKTFKDTLELTKKLCNNNYKRKFDKDGTKEVGEGDLEEQGEMDGVPDGAVVSSEIGPKTKVYREQEQCFEDAMKKMVHTHTHPKDTIWQEQRIQSFGRVVTTIGHYVNTLFDNNMLNSLIQYFNLRKNSLNIKKQRFQKNGGLDIRSLAKYRVTDNIFKNNAVKTQEQNHAFIGFVDYSGSMQHISNTVLQFIKLLSDFFDRFGIPYTFYGWDSSGYNVDFYEIINSGMSADGLARRKQELLTSQFGGGGTPLDKAVLSAIELTETFIQRTGADVTNAIWITDGDGNGPQTSGDIFLPISQIWINTSEIEVGKEIPTYIEAMSGRVQTTSIHIGIDEPSFFSGIEEGSKASKILINQTELGSQMYMKNLAKKFVEAVV